MSKQPRPIITLTTDFGLQDAYVGSLYGVLNSQIPSANIVDISHSIPSYDILHGAHVIGVAHQTFPKGSVHVGVVDPGVGSKRRPIIIKTKEYYFVGPDNGLFSAILVNGSHYTVYEINNYKYCLDDISSTFHGRDIFCPVAAYLSKGVKPNLIGKKISKPIILNSYNVEVKKNKLIGQILSIDKFGNVMTNISKKRFEHFVGKKNFKVELGRACFNRLNKTYSEVKRGDPVMVFSSSQYLEMALYQGSFKDKWKIKMGDLIYVSLTH